MSDKEEILKAINGLRSDVNNLKSEVYSGFKSINKRLDGIEHELRKIDTVLHYSEQYDNIVP